MDRKESLEYDKMNSLINELKINVNKKEDDIKNIINEKDIIIKELKNKIIDQDNKIECINKKIEKIIDAFINELKEKDKEINQIKLNILDQEMLIENNNKQTKNIINDNIYEINNKMNEKGQNILKEYYHNSSTFIEVERRQIEQIYRFNEQLFKKLNRMEEFIVEIKLYNNKEKEIKKIEKSELFNEIKMYKLLEDKFPENKQELVDKNGIKKYIDLYRKDPNINLTNYYQIKEEEMMLKHYKEEKDLIFKKEIEKIKADINTNFIFNDLNNIKKNCDLLLKEIEMKMKRNRFFVDKIIKDLNQSREENNRKANEKRKKTEEEYKKRMLEIENKKNKKENLIQKEEYYNKKKNVIQDEKI